MVEHCSCFLLLKCLQRKLLRRVEPLFLDDHQSILLEEFIGMWINNLVSQFSDKQYQLQLKYRITTAILASIYHPLMFAYKSSTI